MSLLHQCQLIVWSNKSQTFEVMVSCPSFLIKKKTEYALMQSGKMSVEHLIGCRF